MEVLDSEELENNPITVEIARLEDAEAMVRIHDQSWLETYPNEEAGISENDIRRHIASKAAGKVERYRKWIETQGADHGALVARQGGAIVGLSFPQFDPDGRRRLGGLYALKEVHGQGAGQQLFDRAMAWHGNNDVYLNVTTYNERARRFYEKNGFTYTGKDGSENVGGIAMPTLEMVHKKNNRNISLNEHRHAI